jgi:hydroxymethylbilane synthase
MTRTIRIGSRGSALARWQSNFIAARLGEAAPDVTIEIVEISSRGDEVTDQPLWHVEGTGFFTATIERALVGGDVDVAVHSFKDLPVESTPGLVVAAVPARASVEDVLCARDRMTLAMLPARSRVGTCSARRLAQIRALRPDLDLQPLRGNVPTRVARVTSGELDAIVLARAGLERLGLDRHITEVFPLDLVLPAPAQGALAVQCRAADAWIASLLSVLEDAPTRRAVDAERTLLHALGGGCSVPVGAIAQTDGDDILLRAGVFGIQPPRAIRVQRHGSDPVALGEAAARQLIDLGASTILEAFDKTARLDVTVASREDSLVAFRN